MVIFKTCEPYTNCIDRINNIQVDDAHNIDAVMSMYNLIEYSDNYSKTSGNLWQYCRNQPTVDDNGNDDDDNDDNSIFDSFKIKEKVASQNRQQWHKKCWNNGNIKISKYFWRTLEMPLINCEINIDLTWSKNCIIVAPDIANQGTTFPIADTKCYFPVVTLSTQDNAKMLEQLRFGFKRTINCNVNQKYQQKDKTTI